MYFLNKKLKFMVPALVMTIALMGAGYSAWSDKTTATTKISTGELKIQFEKDAPDSFYAQDGIHKYIKNNLGCYVETDYLAGENNMDPAYGSKTYDIEDPNYTGGAQKIGNNYVYTIEPTFGDKAVSFSFKNMHPGTTAITRYEMRNFGTIPAKVTGIRVFVTGNNDLKNAIRVNYTFNKHHGGESTVTTLGTDDVALTGLQDSLNNKLVKNDDAHLLLPDITKSSRSGDEIEVSTMNFYIPANALNDNKGQNANIQVKVQFEFGQYNYTVDEGVYN